MLDLFERASLLTVELLANEPIFCLFLQDIVDAFYSGS